MKAIGNRKMIMGAAVVGIAFGIAGAPSAAARTVALWPLGHNRTESTIDTSCAVRPWYFKLNATTDVSVEDSTPDNWNLPPKPVAESELDHGAAVRHCVCSSNDGAMSGGALTVSEQNLANYLYPTNNFTIEGWMRLDAFDGVDQKAKNWRIIVQAGNGSGSNLGWMLSLRTNGNADNAYLNFYSRNMGEDKSYPYTGDKAFYNFIDGQNAVKLSDLFGVWHHYAIAFDYVNPDNANQSRYRLYFDNRLVGTVTQTKIPPEVVTGTATRFDIGGRSDTTGQHIKGAFSYWRVCDEALQPADFLTANGTVLGTTVPADPDAQNVTALSLTDTKDLGRRWVNTGVQVRGDATSNCTFEAWINPHDRTGIMSQFSGGDYRSNWTISGDKLLFRMYDPVVAKTWIDFYSTRSIPYNRWSHVAFVMDKDTWRFYINGEEDAVRTGCGHLHLIGASSNCDGVVLGAQRLWYSVYDPNLSANLDIAEARVWKRARTAEEIFANYRSRIAKPENETDLIGYWPLCDGTPEDTANGLLAVNYANIDVNGSAFYQREWGVTAYFSLRGFVTNGIWKAVQNSSLVITGDLPVVSTAILNNYWTNGINTQISQPYQRFTYTGWYFPAYSQSNVENCILSKALGGNGRFHLREYGGRFDFWIGGGDGGVTNEDFRVYSSFSVGKWNHVAFVRDGSKYRLYINGELAGGYDGISIDIHPTASFHIAGFYAGGSDGAFHGLVKEVGLWRTVLTPEQIKETMTSRPNGTEKKLVGYWPIDDASGQSLRNLKEGGAPAVVVGGVKGAFRWETLYGVPKMPNTLDFPVPGFMLILR